MSPSISQASQWVVYTDASLPPRLVSRVQPYLTAAYPGIVQSISTLKFDPKDLQFAYDPRRDQLHGGKVLRYIANIKPPDSKALLITGQDAWSDDLNFVFGVAQKGMGCFVTTYRLCNDPDFVGKEAVHEVGHVLGLGHCRLPCVMTFSNSVAEARMKNPTLCDKCKRQLGIDGKKVDQI